MQCLTPIRIKQPDGLLILAPCNHCVKCSVKRQMAWTLRICLEAQSYTRSSFLTLTYNEDTRPGELLYEHITTFLQKYRHATKGPVRYWCTGEHGKLRGREHWHLILFGSQFQNMGPFHTPLWPHGGGFLGDVTAQSASYVARYALKTGPNGHRYIVNMSGRPGIGLRRVREIGTHLGVNYPNMPSLPSWWRLGGRLFPLDQTARTALMDSYHDAGGVFLHYPNQLRNDIETRLYAIRGDSVKGDQLNSIGWERLEREEISHGAL